MTRWRLIALGTCLLAAACGDDNNTTGPSATPIVFTADLNPASEVPPIANAESSGRGSVQITFDVTRDASNAITGATATFYIQLTGFPAGTNVVAAHIHPGPAGINGPVLVNTGIVASSTPSTTDQFITFSLSGIAVNAANANAIVANPATYYFNVHSPTNPGGFARGQLVRIQ